MPIGEVAGRQRERRGQRDRQAAIVHRGDVGRARQPRRHRVHRAAPSGPERVRPAAPGERVQHDAAGCRRRGGEERSAAGARGDLRAPRLPGGEERTERRRGHGAGGDRLEGIGIGRVPHPVARPRVAEHRAGRRAHPRRVRSRRHEPREVRRDREPAARRRDGGSKELRPVHPPRRRMERAQPGEPGRHRDRRRAGRVRPALHDVRQPVGAAPAPAPRPFVRHRARRPPGGEGQALRRRLSRHVPERRAEAAGPGVHRVDHGLHEGGGHGRVGGASPGAQHVRPGIGGRRLRGDDGPHPRRRRGFIRSRSLSLTRLIENTSTRSAAAGNMLIHQ